MMDWDFFQRAISDAGALAHAIWQQTIRFSQGEILGVDIALILLGAAAILLFLLLPGIAARLLSKKMASATDERRPNLDSKLANATKPPFRLLPVILALVFIVQYLEPEGDLRWGLDNLIRTLVAIAIFWALFRIVDPLSFLVERWRDALNGPMIDWILKTAKVAIAVFGVTAVLEIWGVNVAALLAGLGLVGVAVALGAQDLFKNLIAGLMILAERRFGDGDWIEVDGVVEGTVVQIGFRSTSIKRFDLSPVYVPNAELSDHALVNYSRMDKRRIFWMVSVRYDTTIEQLRRIRDGIEGFIVGNEDFVQPEEGTMLVRVDHFSDSSIDLLVYCFTHTTEWDKWLEIKEGLAYHIKEIVEGAETGFAYPSRSLYLEADNRAPAPDMPQRGDGEPDRFEPPEQNRTSGSSRSSSGKVQSPGEETADASNAEEGEAE